MRVGEKCANYRLSFAMKMLRAPTRLPPKSFGLARCVTRLMKSVVPVQRRRIERRRLLWRVVLALGCAQRSAHVSAQPEAVGRTRM